MLGFKKDPCTIVAPDGSVRSDTEALFSSSTLIIIEGAEVIVLPGDEIRRRLPNGTEEAFNVIDPVFYDEHFGPHFQVKVTRKGIFPKHSGGNYTVHVSGPNSRVNIASQDHSINIAADTVFGDISTALRAGVRDPKKLEELLAAVEDMKRQRGSGAFVHAYQRFIGLCADHIGVISPFLPALANMIGGA